MTKLDRLARSVPDARAIADELATGEIKLGIGGSVHDPTDGRDRSGPPGIMNTRVKSMITSRDRTCRPTRGAS